jgi:hypothetical protein
MIAGIPNTPAMTDVDCWGARIGRTGRDQTILNDFAIAAPLPRTARQHE